MQEDLSSPTGSIRKVLKDYKFFWYAFGVVLVDQLVKLIVKFTMQPGQDVPVVGDAFRINFIENRGAAFGLTIADLFNKVGVEMTEETAKLLLTIFSIGAVMVIAYLLSQVRNHRSALPYFLALILGGALGNIIDRVFYGVWFSGMNWYEGGLFEGRVVDMFYLDFYQGEFLGIDMNLLPVFNLADLAISIGIVAVILFQRRFMRIHQERGQELENQQPEEGASEASEVT